MRRSAAKAVFTTDDNLSDDNHADLVSTCLIYGMFCLIVVVGQDYRGGWMQNSLLVLLSLAVFGLVTKKYSRLHRQQTHKEAGLLLSSLQRQGE